MLRFLMALLLVSLVAVPFAWAQDCVVVESVGGQTYATDSFRDGDGQPMTVTITATSLTSGAKAHYLSGGSWIALPLNEAVSCTAIRLTGGQSEHVLTYQYSCGGQIHPRHMVVTAI